MEARNNIYKTLSILFQPSDELQSGTVHIDIGKYYDNNAVRVAKSWVYGTFEDVTAGASPIPCDATLFLRNTKIMQLPLASVTVEGGLGVSISMDAPVVPGYVGGQFDFLGDVVLETPVLDLFITGYKKSPGGYPAEYRFVFWAAIQLEFNFDNLNEQILSRI